MSFLIKYIFLRHFLRRLGSFLSPEWLSVCTFSNGPLVTHVSGFGNSFPLLISGIFGKSGVIIFQVVDAKYAIYLKLLQYTHHPLGVLDWTPFCPQDCLIIWGIDSTRCCKDCSDLGQYLLS